MTSVTFTADSYLSANPFATWTVGFTTSSSGALTTGNTVDVSFPAGFIVTGAVAGFGSGFSSCTAPTVVISGQTVIVPLTGASCSLAANTAATLLITGIFSPFDQYANLGFSVGSYTDSTFTTPIDTTGRPTGIGGINILAAVAYSPFTSAGAPVTGGTPPVDASSPYSVAVTTVTVLGNTGSLTLAGYTFAGWCTTANAADPTLCTGTHYNGGDTFTIGANTALFSQWNASSAADGSGTNSVSPPSVTASSAGNTLSFTYTAATGGTNAGEVDIAVPSGWSAPTASAAAGCTTASAGTLSFSGQTIKVSALTLAGSGALTITYGAKSGGSCTTGSGALAQSSSGTATFATTEKSAAGGTLTAIGASPTVTVNPLTCPAGYFLDNGSCKQWPAGFANGVPCAPGSYAPDPGSVACKLAPVGAFVSSAAATSSTPCALGTFAANEGTIECTRAPPGSYVASLGARAETPCDVGTFTNKEASTSCTPARPGNFVSSRGAKAETPCDVGTFTNTAASTSCTPARPGTFVPSTGSRAAILCDTGTFAATQGAIKCRPADAGSFVNERGATAQHLCPKGTFSAKAEARICTESRVGRFVPVPGATADIPCPRGTYTDTSGSKSCQEASAGFKAVGKPGTHVVACPADTFSADNATACTPCPTGTWTKNTDASTKDKCVAKPGSPPVAAADESTTTTALALSDATLTLGRENDGTFTVTVKAVRGKTVPSGNVTVKNGQDTLCSATLDSRGVGTCKLAASQLAKGTYSSISAVYAGVAKQTRGSRSEDAKLTVSAAAAPILPPVITSLDSSTCLGRISSGTTTVGMTACPSLGSSILINGRNFFYSTTITPGLCQSLYYVTFFQLLCLLSPAAPGTVVNVQAFTPGMGQTPPKGFTVTYLDVPTITTLAAVSCTGAQIGLALDGCPSVGGSVLVITGTNFLPSSTVTTGLCSNLVWVNLNTLNCTLSSGIAPGSTISVVVTTLAGSSRASGISISF